MPNEIPQTQILSEATLSSLQEVLNLDPEKYNQEHRDTAIEAMREWRRRIAAADTAGTKIAKAPKVPQQQIAPPSVKLEDLF